MDAKASIIGLQVWRELGGIQVTIIGTGLLVLAAATTVIQAERGPLAHLPGPWYTKYTRLVLLYQWLKAERPRYVHTLHKKYGPVVRVAPTEAHFNDVSAKQEIYSSKERFLKSPWYQKMVGSFSTNVFSTADISFHRRHRRLLAGPLSDSSLKIWESCVREKVNLAISRMGEEMKTRGAADVFKWWLFMTTDVIGELTFGDSFRILEYGKKNQYIQDLEVVAEAAGFRAAFPDVADFFQAYKIPAPLKAIRNAARSARNLQTSAVQSLERYRGLLEAGRLSNPTLFTKVFQAHNEETLSFDEIRADAQAFIIAGSDTTALTLMYLVWAVCKQPAIRDRLVAEVMTLKSDFTDQDARELPYLGQCIEETLRLYSASPGALPRVVPPEGAELAGYHVKGGMTVCSQAYSLHRHPEIFPNPDNFEPSRWENPSKIMKDAFMPFGGGARVCIGLHLARMELRLATALFFRTFPNAKVSELEGMNDADMVPKIYFLLTPRRKRCLIQAE